MPGALTRTWFVTTSPRNPAKLSQELELLSHFDGKDWWKKDPQGQPVHQLEFARQLAQSDFFEGSVSSRYPALAARDRLRAPQMFGLAYVDEAGTLRITPAGWQLIRNEFVHELFLRQLLKWQFPSWQHGGNPRTSWRYETFLEAGVHPFRETLRVALELKGITKDEIAIFLLPCACPADFVQAVSKIRQFRQSLAAVSGVRPRREFLFQTYRREFQEVYAKDIQEGRILTRETPAEAGKELEHFLETKRRNARDYADAAMRYFRYTGLFTQRGNRLVVSMITDAQRIFAEIDLPLRTDYRRPDSFYGYFGDPTAPQFPWEQPEELADRLAELVQEMDQLTGLLDRPAISLPPLSVREQCHWAQEKLAELKLQKLKQDWTLEEIDKLYADILDRRVSTPPLFMEWNTWRGFFCLNQYCQLKPNFSLDLEWLPISHAGGRQPDIEVIYCGQYAVAVEVTLSRGHRQFATETEPVTRHVERFQERVGIESFGLFIAPRLQNSTLDWFKYHAERRGIIVIPLRLKQFRSLLEVWSTSFSPEKLYNLLVAGREACLEASNVDAWLASMRQIVTEAYTNSL